VTPQNWQWQTVMSKKGRQFFFRKNIGVTPSVAAPGVTHPSDATALRGQKYMNLFVEILLGLADISRAPELISFTMSFRAVISAI